MSLDSLNRVLQKPSGSKNPGKNCSLDSLERVNKIRYTLAAYDVSATSLSVEHACGSLILTAANDCQMIEIAFP